MREVVGGSYLNNERRIKHTSRRIIEKVWIIDTPFRTLQSGCYVMHWGRPSLRFMTVDGEVIVKKEKPGKHGTSNSAEVEINSIDILNRELNWYE